MMLYPSLRLKLGKDMPTPCSTKVMAVVCGIGGATVEGIGLGSVDTLPPLKGYGKVWIST